MKKRLNKFIYWAPRILSIIFIVFLALMYLDVISSELSFLQIVVGLFMHNIPAFILLAVVIISWKHELVGAIAFILVGILFILRDFITVIMNGFDWRIAWDLTLVGPALLVGILFIIGWFKKKKEVKPNSSR